MPAAPTTRPLVVIGGVGHLYQGDLDLGRRAVERLAQEPLGDDVAVEEFSYGAVAVAQRLQDLAPELLILIGAKQRGRMPGSVERREVVSGAPTVEQVQAAISDAVTGYIDIDLVLDVGLGLGALPARTVVIEVEPVSTEPAEELTALAKMSLVESVELARDELGRFFAARRG